MDDGPIIRLATPDDVDALMALEQAAFNHDRLTRRSLRRFVDRPTAACLVAEHKGEVVGYALLLFRLGTAMARLYSIAVSPAMRGMGLGEALMAAAEKVAFGHACIFLRLEVRADNAPAIALYRKLGYRQFGRYLDYYYDHTDALRFEKRLSGDDSRPKEAPPYYHQTTDFTCGPACMIMALAWFDRSLKPDRRLEFRLWREATTIFMTSGLGGCEPFGMAVALARRDLRVTIYTSQTKPFFLENVKSAPRREIMRFVQEDFRAQAKTLNVGVERRALSREALAEALANKAVAIILVSGYRIFHDSEPHWLLVHSADEQHVFVHDPWLQTSELESPVAAAGLPIPWNEFERMARVGRDRRAAALLVYGDMKP